MVSASVLLSRYLPWALPWLPYSMRWKCSQNTPFPLQSWYFIIAIEMLTQAMLLPWILPCNASVQIPIFHSALEHHIGKNLLRCSVGCSPCASSSVNLCSNERAFIVPLRLHISRPWPNVWLGMFFNRDSDDTLKILSQLVCMFFCQNEELFYSLPSLSKVTLAEVYWHC